MKDILLIMPQGELLETLSSLLSSEYRLLCFDRLPDGGNALDDPNLAAVLVDLAHEKERGLAIAKKMMGYSAFLKHPILGLTASLPGEEEAALVENGFFDIIPLPCPKSLLLKRIQSAIRASDSITFHEVERMLKQLPSNIFLKDTEGRYVFSTQYWHHLYHADDTNWSIRGKTDMEIRKDKENAKKAMEADRKILQTGNGTSYIIEEKQDGMDEFLELIKRPVYDADGKISGIIALINNVTEQHLLKQELEKRTQIDPLTELLNKPTTEEHIRMMLKTAGKDWKNGALMMLDVDNFKNVNDSHGHAVGDHVLARIARIIHSNFRVMDVTGRIGGDEFMVFLRNIKETEAVCNSARRIQQQVRAAFPELPGGISISIGIALYPAHGVTFEELYRAADAALYEVKNRCKGNFHVYGEGAEEKPEP
ncbi:MAG: diguanylate cyclase [Clostridia bacterium]|nr:diguanylate cyclase [Clostridia bacterium]